ncbi:MAG: hypothetical protein FWF10_07010 [Clostridiales bacterium]|nr:hypothetical protein [Clostridiales bacterium]
MSEGRRERLREQFWQHGSAGMADYVLLELFLSFIVPRRDTQPAARALIAQFGSLENVFLAKQAELEKVSGVGENTASFLKVAGELHARTEQQRFVDKHGHSVLKNPIAACGYALSVAAHDVYETLRMVALDARGRVLRCEILATGSLTEVPLDMRRTIEQALLSRASDIILIHNHPSGNECPALARRCGSGGADRQAGGQDRHWGAGSTDCPPQLRIQPAL